LYFELVAFIVVELSRGFAIMSHSQKVITDTNKAPLVQVLALLFAVIAILACVVRAGTKIHMVKTLKRDDILAIVATVGPNHIYVSLDFTTFIRLY
jgi:hypothetical protein